MTDYENRDLEYIVDYFGFPYESEDNEFAPEYPKN